MNCFDRPVTSLSDLRTSPAHRLILLLIVLVSVSSGSQPLEAQERKFDSPVRLMLEPLSIRSRSASPIPVQIKLEYNAPQILEGDLLLQVYNSFVTPEDLVATIRYEGIVLQGNDYFLRTVLPPIEASNSRLYQVVGWFDTADKRYSVSRDPENDDEPHDLLSVSPYDRSLLLCSVSGQRDFLKPLPNRRFLNRAMRLSAYDSITTRFTEQSDNQLPSSPASAQQLQDYTCSWDAFSLPEDPLHYCCFDVVLLADQALSRLEESQLKGLDRWLQAGGSLCVYPDDSRLSGLHLQYLLKWFERADDPSVGLSLTDGGSLLRVGERTDAIVNRFYGLGRVTLLPVVDDVATMLQSAELKSAVGHLWKVRASSGLFNDGRVDIGGFEQYMNQRGLRIERNGDSFVVVQQTGGSTRRMVFADLPSLRNQYSFSFQLQPTTNPLALACETGLMPKGVRIVPSSVIALLLVGYVITIGPIDYFLLGYFRRRKYTWVLFPLVTAGFTLLTVSIAHSYMASSDTGGRLSVIDLVDDGVPVRQTDLQMHFYGSQTTHAQDVKNAFLIPARFQNLSPDMSSRMTTVGDSRQIHYAGRFPQNFSTTQAMRQWSPQLNRTTTLAPEDLSVPALPWDDASLVTDDRGRRRIGRLLREAKADDELVDAIVLHLDQRFPLLESEEFMFTTPNLRAAGNWGTVDPWTQRQNYAVPTSREGLVAAGILEASSRRQGGDFFSIVSQVSPQGSSPLEDLPLLDPTDPRQWMLIVVVQKGDQIKVYRRLHIVESQSEQQAAISQDSGQNL